MAKQSTNDTPAEQPAPGADETPAVHARFTAMDGNVALVFIPGVPTRDLTRAEWLALDKDTRALCRSTGVYTLASHED